MIDSNVSGDFNLLSPICTELGDADSEKNMFHYITTDEDANKMLQELTEVMDRNIRNHVSKYPDLCSYNKDNPNIYEPYHFVFIKDITETLRDKRQIDKLTRLLVHSSLWKGLISQTPAPSKLKIPDCWYRLFSAIQHIPLLY